MSTENINLKNITIMSQRELRSLVNQSNKLNDVSFFKSTLQQIRSGVLLKIDLNNPTVLSFLLDKLINEPINFIKSTESDIDKQIEKIRTDLSKLSTMRTRYGLLSLTAEKAVFNHILSFLNISLQLKFGRITKEAKDTQIADSFEYNTNSLINDLRNTIGRDALNVYVNSKMLDNIRTFVSFPYYKQQTGTREEIARKITCDILNLVFETNRSNKSVLIQPYLEQIAPTEIKLLSIIGKLEEQRQQLKTIAIPLYEMNALFGGLKDVFQDIEFITTTAASVKENLDILDSRTMIISQLSEKASYAFESLKEIKTSYDCLTDAVAEVKALEPNI